jgi:hypothetical protein
MDLPDFFDNECRGDLSAIDCSLIGNLCGSVLGRYAPHGICVRLSGVVMMRSAAAEARRQLAVLLSGSCTITATGETRCCGPGDVLLVEDTTGWGHSGDTSDGFTVLLISLE